MTAAIIVASWFAVGGLFTAAGALLERHTNDMNAQIHRTVIDLTEAESDRLICDQIERATRAA